MPLSAFGLFLVNNGLDIVGFAYLIRVAVVVTIAIMKREKAVLRHL